MNLAALISFTITMTLGMSGLTVAVYRNRGRTQPANPPTPRTVYEQTVAALGNPEHIHFDTTWPTTQTT
jgi:hypothetical protein